ncbi:LodA/GoxA family CTQ-dependent oxidase [Eilatimonas milleporae]|uniref:L-lysine 6-oxidase n=1 Tax=Eilatimonas milleporae TaxID=911205 RepID=A0A3M0CDU6_9PROT|nr:LodA/GoxA family CTQ-dependent oxidase [Eilatimonas milleporae]RMB07928.1 hypothetical protein BXY39_2022 [Eilatimonas milleporae]
MSNTYFRVHPAINIARVGNSDSYYIAPETAAGDLIDKESGLFGGLPTNKDTGKPVEAADFRDSAQKVVRQAARFRIYAYDRPQDAYPGTDPGREIKIGDTVGGKTVKDIVWMVHLANKKNNFFQITSANGEEEGINAYKPGPDGKYNFPPVRDPSIGPAAKDGLEKLAEPERLKKLVIDPGPRTIASSAAPDTVVPFNAATPCTFVDDKGNVVDAPYYPVSFPDDHFKMYQYFGAIDTLGELRIEKDTGRLVIAGGYGRASGIEQKDGGPPPMTDAIDNNYWFDDIADGPVNATVLFDDGSTAEVVAGWFVTSDPGYAPQTRNIVSTWDDIFNTWVENLDLMPDLYSGGTYQSDYKAVFNRDILPVFHGAFLQRWNTNLPSQGINGHDLMASITPRDKPSDRIPSFKSLMRDPNIPQDDDEGVKMPLSLGDATKSFLSVSPTQYFLMMQWYDNRFVADAPPIGPGERLDRDVLLNCLGGRYSPGIELTFIVRDVNLYDQDWKGATGPFRINQDRLDYTPYTEESGRDKIPLGVGYIPLQTARVQPGDLSKFMSQPWHTDYNSCAVHLPDPNPDANNTLYWSWPSQRPVQVHPADLCHYDAEKGVWNLGGQLFSVRGDGSGPENGTHTNLPQKVGRFQEYPDFVENWHKVGFIIQGTQIPADHGDNYGSDKFLEIASLFTGPGDLVQPWPTAVLPTGDD